MFDDPADPRDDAIEALVRATLIARATAHALLDCLMEVEGVDLRDADEDDGDEPDNAEMH